MSVVVTGGGGFIGSHLVEGLLKRGERVSVIDDFSTGKRQNLERALGMQGLLEVVEADIREVGPQMFEGAETVFHLAALGSVPRSVDDPKTAFSVNAGGTLNLLSLALEAGVRRFVLASSSSVYGESGPLPRTEQMSPRPASPYAASKLAAEGLVSAFTHSYGIWTATLRFFNVFGPRQDPLSRYAAVVPRFIKGALGPGELLVYGDGEQTRDFTYVGDVVKACILTAESGAGPGQLFNVCAGEERSINRLAERTEELAGRELRRITEPARKGDVRRSVGSPDAFLKVIGEFRETSFDEGLELTWEYARSLGRR